MSNLVNGPIKIVLLDTNEKLCELWRKELQALRRVLPHFGKIGGVPVEIDVHHGTLSSLSGLPLGQTSIVSPGNSYGFLGGGFDLAIAKFFNPGDWKDFEREFQTKLYQQTKGYATRGHMVQLDMKWTEPWTQIQCDSILHIPTMRVPKKIHREPLELNRLIFDLTWDLLAVLTRFNNRVSLDQCISNVIVPGMATGYGGVPLDICSKAMCYAIAIYCADHITHEMRSRLCLKYLGEDPSILFPNENWDNWDFSTSSPEELFPTAN